MARYIRVIALKPSLFPIEDMYTVGKDYECLPVMDSAPKDTVCCICDDEGDLIEIYQDDPDVEWEYVLS